MSHPQGRRRVPERAGTAAGAPPAGAPPLGRGLNAASSGLQSTRLKLPVQLRSPRSVGCRREWNRAPTWSHDRVVPRPPAVENGPMTGALAANLYARNMAAGYLRRGHLASTNRRSTRCAGCASPARCGQSRRNGSTLRRATIGGDSADRRSSVGPDCPTEPGRRPHRGGVQGGLLPHRGRRCRPRRLRLPARPRRQRGQAVARVSRSWASWASAT
jgi:hypothetical protein